MTRPSPRPRPWSLALLFALLAGPTACGDPEVVECLADRDCVGGGGCDVDTGQCQGGTPAGELEIFEITRGAVFVVEDADVEPDETHFIGLDVQERVQFAAATFTDIEDESCDADSILSVFDLAGNEIAFNDDDPGRPDTLCSFVSLTLDTGGYLLGVGSFSGEAGSWDVLFGAPNP